MFEDTGFTTIILLNDLTWTQMPVQVGLRNTPTLTRWLRTSLETI